MDRGLREIAYEVRLSPDGGGLEWTDGGVRYTSEPGAGVFKRLWIAFLSLLPIEWLL
jgi:putative cardiolipin synthase